MRIVAGRHKGRRIEVPSGSTIRPTTDQVREAAFNILAHAAWAGGDLNWWLTRQRVLDAFAGTGALGLEALSRGAPHVVFMDKSVRALAAVRRNLEMLREKERATVLRGDATDPPHADEPCSLVLMDPPYGEGLAAPALAALAKWEWLADGAVCMVELRTRDALEPPAGFRVEDERRYGNTKLVFLTWRKD